MGRAYSSLNFIGGEYETAISVATPLPMLGFDADGTCSDPRSPDLAADFSADQCQRSNPTIAFRWGL